VSDKQVWVLAGGNGAGKSTFYRLMLESKGLVFINADQIARHLDADNPEGKSYEAAIAAMSLFQKFANDGRSFCYETVFSHESKLELIERAKTAGYEVVLVYIHLVDDLHELRVIQRVSEGGHSVDNAKIKTRLLRTVQHVRKASTLVDELMLFDNSSIESPFELIAHKHGDVLDVFIEPLPTWAQKMLSIDQR
jgi:predicted ABC-type ATPase